MKKLFFSCIAAVVSVACNQPILDDEVITQEVQGLIIDDPLLPPITPINPITGNPYAVSTMRDAFLELQANGAIPTDADIDDYIYTSHLYVKFSPESDEQIDELLADSTMILYPYPIDNEMTEANDEYTVRPEEGDTTTVHFYTAVPSNKTLPTDIPYTILENLYIPDECSGNNASPSMKTVSGGDISESIINDLVSKSFELSGDITFIDPLNNTPEVEQMSSLDDERWQPAGNISAYDDIWGGQVPLQGIEVRARRWFTTHKGTTDAAGNFVCNGTFKKAAVYSFKWEGSKWDIRDGATVQAYYRGPKQRDYWNLCIESGKSLAYAAIHRAAYRWYHGNVQGLTRPIHIGRVKFKYFHSPNDNSTTTGGYVSTPTAPVSPTVKIWGKDDGYNLRPVSKIFKTACHELGHIAHDAANHQNFRDATKFLKESWARCAEFLLAEQEYREKQALSKLYEYEYRIVGIDDNGENIYTLLMVPDNDYNYQKWDISDNFKANYTPLFIDLIDDYNQNSYYFWRLPDVVPQDTTSPQNGVNSTDPPIPEIPGIISIHPVDHIKNMPPPFIQSLVFRNTTRSGIKNALLQYVQSNPAEATIYNLTNNSINTLFCYYELEDEN